MNRRILLVTFAASLMSAADRLQSRSVVYSTQGIVATSHVLASQAGAQVLARGGSAVDAAIAANAVLGVVEPMQCGLGGDLFAMYWEAKSGKLYGLNSSGWAPKALTPQLLAKLGHNRMPSSGIHTVTVPGAVEGWSKMHGRFGKLPWKELFGAAIGFAQQGHPVHEVVHSIWAVERLQVTPEAQRVFLPDGRRPEVGELFRNPDMARSLRVVAEQGCNGYYRGPIAQALVAASMKLGGTMTAEDLAEFAAEWVEPVSTTYRGWRVYELPPNGQGMAALVMLNLMERAGHDLHSQIEAMKLAYADLLEYNADPRFAKVPVGGLLDKSYATSRAALINPSTANCAVGAGKPPSSDTTYLAVVDGEGNIASWIQSVRADGGSGVVAEGLGFILQNRGSDFVLTTGHPNQLAPHKRPFHTIIPAFMEKDDVRMAFGIIGGSNQPLAHAQFVSNIADRGMNPQLALEAPRFTKGAAAGCDVQLESRFPAETVKALGAKGHVVTLRGEYSTNMGNGAAVAYNVRTRIKQAAVDPRADGAAVPEPLQAR